MSLFQTSVVKKYLNDLSPELIDKKYKVFQDYFGNAERQENIRNSKEEEYQSGFVSALFVNILEYTLNPEPSFNFVLEKKNVDDSKKADGAILKDNEVIAVIELKSTQTTDLDTVETQAFGYKNHHPKCQYIITSNFEKIRIYIQNAIDHLEFDLFNLSKEDFAMLWLCLSKDNILNDIPLKIKEASVLQEENVTKQLYNDYSKFRKEIFANIVKNNTEFDKLVLFKKTQKLLDRFLFIFFAEDKLLLPPNSISEIVKQWITLKDDLDEYVPLYDRFKKYFGYLNTGFKGKKYDIFAYNGGLFLPDEILDNIKIDDEVLHQNTLQLSTYDFETEVDVNILGHIFEHSLSEIENVQAEIAGEEVDKQKTKRKKDGIFYTPKYITKYIVENTVGKLCNEKRTEFGIIDEEYAKGRRNRKKDIVRDLDNKLIKYREWLLEITILDPACGSGAFLNQALEFLILEHKKVDELKAQLLGGSIIFPDIEAKILEKNIFGVDLNEESVEIAKLSLWLRTAQKGRKLTTLSNHIKCGNSLIDDPEIAGEKAFNWKNEFQEVFVKDGFDVVIGNPPYLNMTLNNTDNNSLRYYIDNYESVKKANSKNIYTLFNELSYKLIKDNSIVSFIIPEGFLKTRSYNDCVDAMEKVGKIYSAVYFEDWVFDDATTGSMIFEFVKNPSKSKEFREYFMNKNREVSVIIEVENPVISKYEKSNFKTIDDYCELFKGMAVKNRKEYISEIKNEQPDVFLLGNCIDRYSITNSFYCDYKELTIVGGTKKIEKHNIAPRILIRRTGDYLCCVMLEKPALTESTLYSCSTKTKDIDLNYVLALLNSKLLTYIVRQKMITNEQAFPQIMMTDIKLLKIPFVDFDIQTVLGNKSKNVSNEYSLFLSKNNNFINYLQSQFNIKKLSKKLQNWHKLDFADFIKELNKAIKKGSGVKLTKKDEMEWMEVFETKKIEALSLKSEIDKTDKEINQMVYELYGLTEEEIKIVEETN